MLGNKVEIWDYVDLLLNNLSKLSRRKKKYISNTEFYDSFFTSIEMNSFYSGIDRRRIVKQNILKQIVDDKIADGGKLLDVGCGLGDNINHLNTKRIKIYGIEYSDQTISLARPQLANEIEIMQGSALALPFDSEYFDCVFCLEVLEHIDDQWQALREINRVLKRGAYFVLSVPFRHWFPSFYSNMGHFRHYTKNELDELLIEFGFETVEWLPNFPKWNRFANYCYVFTRIVALSGRLLGKKIYPHEVKIPFTRKYLLVILYNLIDGIYNKEAKLNYANMPTSTFMLARKI